MSLRTNPTLRTLACLGLLASPVPATQHSLTVQAHAGMPSAGELGPQRRHETRIQIFSSTANELVGRVEFGPAAFTAVSGPAGQTFQRVEVSGADATEGPLGFPAVPVLRELIGVPQGAVIGMQVTSQLGEVVPTMLYPFQQDAEDGPCGSVDDYPDGDPPECVYDDYPFVLDAAAYTTNGTFPEFTSQVSEVGSLRDLRVAQIAFPVGHYNPVQQLLTLYQATDFVITFDGSAGHFVTEAALSPFEPGESFYARVLNDQVLMQDPGGLVAQPEHVGAEFLILTHPDFRDQADQLRVWKNEKGIPTAVYEVNDGTGPGPDTVLEIDDYIVDKYKYAQVRPSYVLLLGDAEFIPTHYKERHGYPGIYIPTDFPYSTVGHDGPDLPPTVFTDLLPDLAIGRFPVNNPQEAQTVVDKVIGYENGAPGQDSLEHPFYKRATVASGFQCCRTNAPDGASQREHIQNSEHLRNHLLSEAYEVDRIYGETVASEYMGDPTPRLYRNLSPLPAEIGPTSGFPWTGSASDVDSAFEQGRFFMMHLFHGSWSGWQRPYFSTAHISGLDNGDLLPFVLSLNCSSGHFDAETDGDSGTNFECFAERLVTKADGGAIGVIAGTRMTIITPNIYLSRGFPDAIWPSLVPAYGSNQSLRRGGDILNHGKTYQLGVFGSGDNNARNHLYLYLLFGDPTLEMWTADPQQTILPTSLTITEENWGLLVDYGFEGAMITAWQQSPGGGALPIGRAPVKDGVAQVEYFIPPAGGGQQVLLSISAENAVSLLTAAP